MCEVVNVVEQGYICINVFDFLEIVVDGKIVWMVYYNYGIWKKDGDVLFEVYWFESVVVVYIEDGWKLKMFYFIWVC